MSLRRIFAVLATPAAVIALVAPASAATVSPGGVSAAPVVPTQGIIMSDGRICNPRWGC